MITIAAVATGVIIAVIVGILPSEAKSDVQVTLDLARIGDKQIALDKRTDTSRTSLTANERDALAAVLAYPDILKILSQQDQLRVQSIVQEDPQGDCGSHCSDVIIAWDEPIKSSLYAAVDNDQDAVTQWSFDPGSGRIISP